MKNKIEILIEGVLHHTFDLGNGITLEKQPAIFDDRDKWFFKKNETIVGWVNIGTEFSMDRQTPRIIDIKIKDEARQQGLGRMAIPRLAKYYGALSSDNSGHTNSDADRMWRSVGGRSPTTDDPPSGKAKFILTP